METYLRVSNKEAQHSGTWEVVSEADAAICPDCHAGPGELCFNLTERAYGLPLPIPHWKRTKQAKLDRLAEPPALGS